jgi:Peptidase C13 family
MDLNGSPEAAPPPTPLRAWLQNLAAGVRLAFFLRPAALPFHVSANQFIAIAASSLAVSIACSLALAGLDGFLNLQALPSEMFWVPLALLSGYLVGRLVHDSRYALLVPIAVGAIGIPLTIASSLVWFAADHRWLAAPVIAAGATPIYQLVFAWWALATLVAISRLVGPSSRRPAIPAAVVALVVFLPAYLVPSEPVWERSFDTQDAGERAQPFSESALYAQPELLLAAEQQLRPGRPGVEDLYFVGFAPYASQDVFKKETLSIGKLMDERFDTAGRSILLISHASVADKYPIATLTSLREALDAVAEFIDPEEDVVLLHLTSHGSESHELSVEFRGLELQAIRPEDLRSALDDAGIKWRIVVVSACYSGGFIEALKDEHTMVVTASDAKHTSFGCGNDFDFTYFSKAYYDEALRKTYSFEQAFVLAKESIRRRELKEGLEPSNPQLYMGAAMKQKLSTLEQRLSRGKEIAR